MLTRDAAIIAGLFSGDDLEHDTALETMCAEIEADPRNKQFNELLRDAYKPHLIDLLDARHDSYRKIR